MISIKGYKNSVIIIILVCLFLLTALYYYSQKDVIATVGSYKIKEDAFKQEMSYRGGLSISELNKKVLLDEMIEKKLLLNKAYELGLDKNPDIQREYEYLLMGKVRQLYIEEPYSEIDITKADYMNYYNQHKESFKKAEQRRFAILFFSKKNNPTDNEQSQLMGKLNEIKKFHKEGKLPNVQKDFGAYSIDYSEHQVSRYQGGILGWFTKTKEVLWEEKVIDAGFHLQKEGDISEIIETDKGFYLIRFTQMKKSKYISFEKVENQIRYKLIKERQMKIKEDFKKQLLKEFSISINLNKLDGIKKDTFDSNSAKYKLPSQTIY